MGKIKYQSKINPEWLQIDRFKKWLNSVEGDDESAFCSIYKCKFDIGNIRISAIESHGKGLKHNIT